VKRIAIIGAGIAGITMAHLLAGQANITVFDKARGVGGRMTTRRAEPYHFDHGAQFFTVKTAAFAAFIQPMIKAGVIQPWQATFAEIQGCDIRLQRQWGTSFPHYVGVPGMSAIAKYLAQDLPVELQTRIVSMQHTGQWALFAEDGRQFSGFDWVIITAPAQQTAALLPPDFIHHHTVLDTHMTACFSLMLGFEQAPPCLFDAAVVRGADISWIAVNSRKPGRPKAFSLLAHATNRWADAHINDDKASVLSYLIDQVSKTLGHDVSKAQHRDVHAWRYANKAKQPSATHYLDVNQHLLVCGDWCIQGRVEAAFTSAWHAAKQLQSYL